MERLRKRYGLPGFGHDLRCCYTDADWRLFANFPELFPEVRRSATADFDGEAICLASPHDFLAYLFHHYFELKEKWQ